jgi:Bacteriophage abortive infection AbiH
MTTLYIIGNGFDIHHGIDSHYSAFGKFLFSKDHETYKFVKKYFAVDEDFWSDFETRLALFDAGSLIEDASDFLVSYGADNWSDSYHHDYQYEIDIVVKALSITMKARFADWIVQLAIPVRNKIEGKMVHLDPAAIFLNFNYTPTLEKLYNVADRQILHIHGSSKERAEALVLGHGWSPKEKGSLNQNIDLEEADIRVIEGNRIVDKYFEATFKPTDQIIFKNRKFFQGLVQVKKIFVMGHSMAEVDLPYFREILRHIDVRQATWKVSYYENQAKVEQQFAKLPIDRDLVEFARLEDF